MKRILPMENENRLYKILPVCAALLLTLGTITMVLGAVMALLSNHLKYILACSSLSQIGFILVGVSMTSRLGWDNALAANGTVLYMVNHSLVKLALFLLAGVVYMNCHALHLNDIRGYGRGKPWLLAVFLCGGCSLAIRNRTFSSNSLHSSVFPSIPSFFS